MTRLRDEHSNGATWKRQNQAHAWVNKQQSGLDFAEKQQLT